MKAGRWKIFIVTLILGGGLLYFAVRDVGYKEPMSLLWMCFVVYLIGKGIFVSFSEEAYKDDKKRAATGKRLFQEKLGIFAPIMPYLHILAIILDAFLVKLCPLTMPIKFLILSILMASVVYAFWLSRWYKKSMKAALEKEPNDSLQT